MASGTWYKATELENVFFSTPRRKEDQSGCCHLEQTETYIHWHILRAKLTSLLYVTMELNRILINWVFCSRSWCFIVPMTSFNRAWGAEMLSTLNARVMPMWIREMVWTSLPWSVRFPRVQWSGTCWVTPRRSQSVYFTSDRYTSGNLLGRTFPILKSLQPSHFNTPPTLLVSQKAISFDCMLETALCPPILIYWSPNSQYLRMQLYLETGPLKRWLS